MKTKKCIAMVLAGGRGERLGSLTHYYSKPAIHFGNNHRIIDFTLNNCKNSGIDTIAVLSQYFTTDLNAYIKSAYENVYLLPSKDENYTYKGTADAVYRNFSFIEGFMPKHVLILASDHIYKMDYNNLLAFHEEKDADVTVASTPVSVEEAPRFGIINTNEDGCVFTFEEKTQRPKSNLASMGVYVFKWSVLKKYLQRDSWRSHSKHDFGNDILPEMLSGRRLYTYQFDGYWRDVGTVDNLWEANMDQFNDSCLQLVDNEWGLSSACGCIKHSILGNPVTVGRNVQIVNSVIMPHVYIGNNVKIFNSIIGNHTVIRDGVVIGDDYGDDFFVDRQVCAGDVSLVSPWVDINAGVAIRKNSHVIKESLANYYSAKKFTDYSSKSVNFAIASR